MFILYLPSLQDGQIILVHTAQALDSSKWANECWICLQKHNIAGLP